MYFDTEAEYDAEIAAVRIELRNAIQAEEWSLNTSQSVQKVKQNLQQIKDYLNELTTERKALIQELAGGRVTSIVFRRRAI